MERLMMIVVRASFLALATSIASACGPSGNPVAPPPTEGMVVVFAFRAHPADTLRALVSDSQTVEQARRIAEGAAPSKFPIGPIVRGAGVDPRYPFHFVPDSVRLTDVAAEVCDAAPMHTSAEVDAFLRGAQSALWCPWDGVPIAVE
jgi:hypothetical protein